MQAAHIMPQTYRNGMLAPPTSATISSDVRVSSFGVSSTPSAGMQ